MVLLAKVWALNGHAGAFNYGVAMVKSLVAPGGTADVLVVFGEEVPTSSAMRHCLLLSCW